MNALCVILWLGLAESAEHNVFTTINAAALPYYDSSETFLTLNQGTVKGRRYPELGIDIFYGEFYSIATTKSSLNASRYSVR